MADLNKIIDELSTLTVVEAADGVKAIKSAWPRNLSLCKRTYAEEDKPRAIVFEGFNSEEIRLICKEFEELSLI